MSRACVCAPGPDADQLGAEPLQPRGHGPADGPESEHHDPGAGQGGSGRFPQSTRLQHASAVVIAARQRQQVQHRHLADPVGVAAVGGRHVADRDPPLGGGVAVDALQPDPVLLDQPRAVAIHHRRVDPSHQRHDHVELAVGLATIDDHLVAGQARAQHLRALGKRRRRNQDPHRDLRAYEALAAVGGAQDGVSCARSALRSTLPTGVSGIASTTLIWRGYL